MTRSIEDDFMDAIVEAMAELGGTVDIIDRDSITFKLYLAEDLVDQAYDIIDELWVYYASKKLKEINEDPFYGVKQLLKEKDDE